MRRIDGDVVCDEIAVSLVGEASHNLQSAPEHPVMNEKHLGSCGNCFADSVRGKIDSCGDATNLTAARELQSVERGRVVGELYGMEQRVESLGYDLGSQHVCRLTRANCGSVQAGKLA